MLLFSFSSVPFSAASTCHARRDQHSSRLYPPPRHLFPRGGFPRRNSRSLAGCWVGRREAEGDGKERGRTEARRRQAFWTILYLMRPPFFQMSAIKTVRSTSTSRIC